MAETEKKLLKTRTVLNGGYLMEEKQIECALPREKLKGIKLFQARNYCPFIPGIVNSNAYIRDITTLNMRNVRDKTLECSENNNNT